MKLITRLVQFAVLAMAVTAPAWAQVTLRSTTLSGAVAVGDTAITLASGTGVAAGMIVYVSGDREVMRVRSISGAVIDVTNARGQNGSPIVGHASGATVYVDLPQYFQSGGDFYGTCAATDWIATPVVNITTGNIKTCSSSLWTITNGPAASAVGLTAIGPNAAGTVDMGSLDTAFRTAYLTNDINFEGTANGFEAILRNADPTVGDAVHTIPDTAGVADTVAMVTLAQTLANKTLTAPVIGAATGTSLSVTGSLTSTIATGTNPIIVTSTTPSVNLNASAIAYNAAGTQQVAGHVVFGTCTLGTSCSITLTGSAAYTSTSSYYCSATDRTSAAATKVVNTAAGTVDITGTGTDVIGYVCFGN